MPRIKVCIDPHCEAVWFNIPKKVTHCANCDMILVEINQDTYRKKFAGHWFQYDYPTRKLIPAEQRGKAVQSDLAGMMAKE